jgi:hypothetical protein
MINYVDSLLIFFLVIIQIAWIWIIVHLICFI